MDQLLLGWLYNIMSSDIASQVLGCKSLQELWNAVKNLLGTQSRSKITFYKSELQRLRKGSLKMDDYLKKIKITDNLFLVGHPLSSEDLITQTLADFDSEYNAIFIKLSEKTRLM